MAFIVYEAGESISINGPATIFGLNKSLGATRDHLGKTGAFSLGFFAGKALLGATITPEYNSGVVGYSQFSFLGSVSGGSFMGYTGITLFQVERVSIGSGNYRYDFDCHLERDNDSSYPEWNYYSGESQDSYGMLIKVGSHIISQNGLPLVSTSNSRDWRYSQSDTNTGPIKDIWDTLIANQGSPVEVSIVLTKGGDSL